MILLRGRRCAGERRGHSFIKEGREDRTLVAFELLGSLIVSVKGGEG
jgi:hypothetical protein